MKQVFENEVIRTILERADRSVRSEAITPGYVGTIVEVLGRIVLPNGNILRGEFEGTLVYFPGVRATELTRS